MQKKTRVIKGKYLLKYSFVMAVLFFLTFFWFFAYGKGFVQRGDGYFQHYISLAYYGEYLRRIAENVFIRHQFRIPMWDMDIGYGADILTTLNYYVIGDPLNLLSVFVPKVYTEFLYSGLILFRIWLAGLSFSYFCLSHDNSENATLIGSFCYSLCSYILVGALKHPFFSNPFIYLPLLFVGVDRIYHGKKPHLYIGMVALAGISNFYFFYMMGIFVVLYAVVLYCHLFRKIEWRKMLGWVGHFVFYSFIGIALSSVILLPAVLGMFGSDRFGLEFYLPLLYNYSHYKALIVNFTAGMGENYSHLGYSAVGFLAVVVLYLRKGENTLLKVLFPVMTVFLCIPYVGHVFNGFSYRTNRWVFAYSLLVAYIVVKAVPVFFTLSAWEKKRMAVITLLYGILCLCLSHEPDVLAKILLLAICCGVICFLGKYLLEEKKQITVLLMLFSICACFQAFALYTPFGENFRKKFIAFGKCYETLMQISPESLVYEGMGKDSAYRFDKSYYVSEKKRKTNWTNINSGMAMERHGVSYYFSVDNPSVSSFLKEMQLNCTSYHRYIGLDSRNILEMVSSVKYFLAGDKEKTRLPRQFDKARQVARKENYVLYEAKKALPVGYTYDSYIPRKVYDNLSAVEKQEALLQGCVLEKSSLPSMEPSFSHRTASCEIEPGKKAVVKHSAIQAKKKGASITLHCKGTVPGELYILFDHLEYQYKMATDCTIKISVNGKVSYCSLRNNKSNFSAGIKDVLVNLGNYKTPVTKIVLTFLNQGKYTFHDISIVSQPMDSQAVFAGQRGEEVLEDVSFGMNEIQGDLSLSKDKILFLSVPYSPGWKAYVDGKPCTLQQANTFGMALEVQEGEHRIQLTYTTPYLAVGALITLIGGFCFLGLDICLRMKQNRTQQESTP